MSTALQDGLYFPFGIDPTARRVGTSRHLASGLRAAFIVGHRLRVLAERVVGVRLVTYLQW